MELMEFIRNVVYKDIHGIVIEMNAIHRECTLYGNSWNFHRE